MLTGGHARLAWLVVIGFTLPRRGMADEARSQPNVAVARLGLPTAYVVGKNAAEVFYRLHGAVFEGRTMRADQVGVLLRLTESAQLSFDFDDIRATGRNKANRFHAQGLGFGIKKQFHLSEHPDTALSFELESRMSNSNARAGDFQAQPPTARSYILNADCSTWLTEANTLHVRASGSRVTLGSELSGWTFGFAAGADHWFGKLFALQANGGVFSNFGDVKGTDVTLSGGLHFGPKYGFFADLGGTLWPAGVPLTGGPLTDAAVFRMDPVLVGQPAAQALREATLGMLTTQLGYRGEW